MKDPAILFPGDSGMASRMRAFEWSRTSLGSPEDWPHNLRTSVQIVLGSRQPMFVCWGPQFVNLYNDGVAELLQRRHPQALGKPAQEGWPEVWHELGPYAAAGRAGQAGMCTVPVIQTRNGFAEEAYVTFSCNPVADDDGGSGGILCPVTDDTLRINAAHQLDLLHEVISRSASARSVRDACASIIATLAAQSSDLPFAVLYLVEDGAPRLVGGHGLERTTFFDSPIAQALERRRTVLVSDLSAIAESLPLVRDMFVPVRAAVLPFTTACGSAGSGALVAGLNPLRQENGHHVRFLELLASGIATSLTNATNADSAGVSRPKPVDQSLFQRLVCTEENERKRIAREIHDQIGQAMTALRLHLQSVHAADTGSDMLGEYLARTQRLAAELDESIDALAWDLRPASLDHLGLADTLRSLVDGWSKRFGIRATLDLSADMNGRLARNVEVSLYRLAQEALHNVVKHAHATHVGVSLRHQGDELTLTIMDDGRGFIVPSMHQPTSGGMGLVSMRERVLLAGGRVEIESSPGAGTVVRVVIPDA